MEKTPLPGLMGDRTDEELDAHTIQHAKYFTVVQVNRGGFVGGGQNYNRHEEPTLEAARVRARELWDRDGKRILIYAIADFAGANNFSRHVDNYPPSNYQSRGDKARAEKASKKAAQERAREARQCLGEEKLTRAARKEKLLSEGATGLLRGFMDDDQPLVHVTRS